MITVDVEFKINEKALISMFDRLMTDSKLMTSLHELLGKYCERYVPKQSGELANNYVATKEALIYPQPYAHYQYAGEVYEPSFPITEKGKVVGFYSKPNEKKRPTGRPLNYTNPLASKEWDKAMLRDNGEAFYAEALDLIVGRFKELYG